MSFPDSVYTVIAIWFILFVSFNMEFLDNQNSVQNHLSPELVEHMSSQRESVLSSAMALLEGGTIEDEVDRGIIMEAIAFIENPTDVLSEIMKQASTVGQVMGGYAIQGIDYPPAIKDMHGYLCTLQCVNRINFIEEYLQQRTDESPEVKEALYKLVGWDRTLSKCYSAYNFSGVVTNLQARVVQLSSSVL